MMKSTWLLMAVAVVGACANNDGPPRQHGQISEAGASAAVANLADLRASMHSGDGNAVADAVLALTAGGQALVAPTGAAPASAVAPPRGLIAAMGKNRAASFTGSVTCDDTGCVYDHFGESDANESVSIDGSIRVTNDTVSVDLTMDVTTADVTMHWALAGSLLVSASEIDGDFHAHGQASTAEASVSWDEDVAYNAIGLDASGCPISGSLDADIAYAASGPQGGGSFALEASIAFGPTCGAYHAL